MNNMEISTEELMTFLEATPFELKEINSKGQIKNQNFNLYSRALESYYISDIESLKEHIENFEKDSILRSIASLRLSLLSGTANDSLKKEVIEIAKSDSPFGAEAALAAGRYCLSQRENEDACELFQLAYQKLEKLGAKKKALKAYQNLLISKTRVYPNKKYIQDYEFLASKAEEIVENAVESMCYHNISRELFYVGAFELALVYSNKALRLLKEDSRTVHYFEALLHRCHLYIKLGHFDKAHADFQYAKTSDHLSTQDAVEAIKQLLQGKTESVEFDHIEPCWKVKLDLNGSRKTIKFSKTETKFLDFVKSEPKERIEIIDHLYGADAHYESSLNKLRVLIHRLKKKAPKLLVEDDSKIGIKDDIYLSA